MKYKITAIALFLAYAYMLSFQDADPPPYRIATLVFAGCVEAAAALCYAIVRPQQRQVSDRNFVIGLVEFIASAVILGLAHGIAPWSLRYSAVMIAAVFQGDGFLRIWRPDWWRPWRDGG